MDLTLTPRIVTNNHDQFVRAHYNLVKRKWYAKYGREEHPIDPISLETSGVKILFSRPENDKHPAWTKRTVTKIENPFEISKWWSVLCEGIAIMGKPNKDGTFKITKILYDNIKQVE